MKKQSHTSRSILHSQLTATISVALVLLMLGIIALTGLTASGIAESIRNEVGFTVVLTDSATARQAEAIGRKLKAEPFTAAADFSSSEQVLQRWNSMLDSADSLLDANPFLPEWNVRVKPQWAHPDSLSTLAAKVHTWPCVSDVTYYDDMATTVNDTLSTLSIILLILTAVLTLISFVLISNTVRLAVHSRRLSIHAMQLVGAKGSFIRRPFISSALVGGLLAAAIASLILAGALCYLSSAYPQLLVYLTLPEIACTLLSLYLIGALICALAAIFATNRYLRRDYDQLFD